MWLLRKGPAEEGTVAEDSSRHEEKSFSRPEHTIAVEVEDANQPEVRGENTQANLDAMPHHENHAHFVPHKHSLSYMVDMVDIEDDDDVEPAVLMKRRREEKAASKRSKIKVKRGDVASPPVRNG